MIKKNNIMILATILLFTILPLNISSFDETYYACGGDNETIISCSLGDEENFFYGLFIPEDVAEAIKIEAETGRPGRAGIIERYLLNLWYFIFFVFFPLFILLLLVIWYLLRKK